MSLNLLISQRRIKHHLLDCCYIILALTQQCTTQMLIQPHSMNAALYFAAIDAESSADITKTTISYVSPSNDIDTESSAVSVVKETTSSYDLSNNNSSTFNYDNDLQFDTVLYLVFMEILLYNQQNVFSYSSVTLKTSDKVYNFHFVAMFGTPFHIIDHKSVLYLIFIQIL